MLGQLAIVRRFLPEDNRRVRVRLMSLSPAAKTRSDIRETPIPNLCYTLHKQKRSAALLSHLQPSDKIKQRLASAPFGAWHKSLLQSFKDWNVQVVLLEAVLTRVVQFVLIARIWPWSLLVRCSDSFHAHSSLPTV